jgi:hypothetical protein
MKTSECFGTNGNRYAAGFARKFDATLDHTSLDFERKIAAFLEYAAYDQHIVRTTSHLLMEEMLTAAVQNLRRVSRGSR